MHSPGRKQTVRPRWRSGKEGVGQGREGPPAEGSFLGAARAILLRSPSHLHLPHLSLSLTHIHSLYKEYCFPPAVPGTNEPTSIHIVFDL